MHASNACPTHSDLKGRPMCSLRDHSQLNCGFDTSKGFVLVSFDSEESVVRLVTAETVMQCNTIIGTRMFLSTFVKKIKLNHACDKHDFPKLEAKHLVEWDQDASLLKLLLPFSEGMGNTCGRKLGNSENQKASPKGASAIWTLLLACFRIGNEEPIEPVPRGGGGSGGRSGSGSGGLFVGPLIDNNEDEINVFLVQEGELPEEFVGSMDRRELNNWGDVRRFLTMMYNVGLSFAASDSNPDGQEIHAQQQQQEMQTHPLHNIWPGYSLSYTDESGETLDLSTIVWDDFCRRVLVIQARHA